MTPPIVIVILLAMASLGVLAWYLLIETEGVYLGRRMVIWLYDVYASRYDRIKNFDDVSEHLYVAQPIIRQLRQRDPLVLDVGTGTGRLPLALCQHASFEGHICGLDPSRRMLIHGARKIADEHFEDYVTFIWSQAERLPFTDHNFDLVTCLEVLEFTPRPRATLAELVRVLRPGGLLVISNRRQVFMPGRRWSDETLRAYLAEDGIDDITIRVWQMDYKLVFGRKAGQSDPIGPRPLADILICPQCGTQLLEDEARYACPQCQRSYAIGEDGVIELG